ncbi:hypothetical protein NMG60_11031196 [Bertholletia excelsa]
MERQNLPFLLDVLYCEEEHWEEEEEKEEIDTITPPNPPRFPDQDLSWEDEELTSLLSKEQETHLNNVIQTTPFVLEARRFTVEWIMQVNAYYSFSTLTAVLAVNYLDRFLGSVHFHGEKPWMSQLAAVACLSLAAKVEETHVPLLLDLQVGETKYLFDAKTVQRMEILVLSTLQWRMNPVTPLSFLDFFVRRVGFKSLLCWEFVMRCESLIFSIISDSRFLSYLPSALASAAMLHVMNRVEPFSGMELEKQLLGARGIDKEKVKDCYKLIEESELGEVGFHPRSKRKLGSDPGSPKGVMEVSFSSDSWNHQWPVPAPASVSSSPEPLRKKLNYLAADVLSFPS